MWEVKCIQSSSVSNRIPINFRTDLWAFRIWEVIFYLQWNEFICLCEYMCKVTILDMLIKARANLSLKEEEITLNVKGVCLRIWEN